MKFLVSCFVIAMVFVIFQNFEYQKKRDNTEDIPMYVDPLIGSDYHGQVFVGANVPF